VTPDRRSTAAFFALVFALAVPFWLVDAATDVRLTPDLPLSALSFACPVAAATILAYREHRGAGVAALLARAADASRIRAKRWYLPTLLLLPAAYGATSGVLRLAGLPLPTVRFAPLPGIAMLVVFLLAGLGEELGWSGYAIDPLQARWGALGGGLLLGLVWAAFHVVPLAQAERAPAWVGWWALGTVAQRVLYTWLYNNTGRSVFAVALFHASGNLAQIGPFLDFGPGGYPLEAQRIAGLILAGVAAVVTIAWGPRTPARRRCA